MKKNLAVLSFLLALVAAMNPFCLAQEATQNNLPAKAASRDASTPERSSRALPEANLPALKQQLQSFQNVLNRTIEQGLDQPFVILQDAKGFYLPRFGVAFHMEVNLYPLRLLSMFDSRPYSAEELLKAKESKRARIRELKERLQQLLPEHAAELEAIPPEQNVVIVVQLFNLPSEQSDDLPTQVVIGASRQTLLDYQAHRLTAEDFRNRGFSFEF